MQVEIMGTSASYLDVRLTEHQPVQQTPAGAGDAVPVWVLQITAPARKAYEEGLRAMTGNDSQRALAHFQKAIQIYPAYASAIAAQGAVKLKLGRTDEAVQDFRRALEIEERLPDACFGLAAVHFAHREFREAEKYLLRVRVMLPDDWRPYYELGEVYSEVEDWPEAEKALQKAIELHRDYPRIHLRLINALVWQEKYSEALAVMDEYLTRFPKDPFASQVRKKRDLLALEVESATSRPPQP